MMLRGMQLDEQHPGSLVQRHGVPDTTHRQVELEENFIAVSLSVVAQSPTCGRWRGSAVLEQLRQIDEADPISRCGGAGQSLAALAVAVSPHDAHAEGGGRVGSVQGVRGLEEGNGARRHAQPLDDAAGTHWDVA